jgi:hypothetical protein
VNWRLPEAKPLWAGLQVLVSVFEEFVIEKTRRGRDKRKRSVGERKTMVDVEREESGIEVRRRTNYSNNAAEGNPRSIR